MTPDTIHFEIRKAGLALGPAMAGAMLVVAPPVGLSREGWSAAAVAVLMAVWWMTEALPIAITALVPACLLPLLEVSTIREASSAYADPLVLLLFGVLLAAAIERWSLHERLAARLRRWGGRDPALQVGGLMAATAFLVLWVSNTASAMVMLPVGQAASANIVEQLGAATERERADTSTAMMLGIAYAATIGGMATLIGTPPNALLAAFMQATYGVNIGFMQWMVLGVPIALVLLVIAWFVLTRLAFRVPRHSAEFRSLHRS